MQLVRAALSAALICLFTGVFTPAAAGQTEYVIVISVDGGGSSYIQNLIDLNLLPNFKRFQTQGAWTNNARNDYDYTVTLPNHVSMVTGLAILGDGGNGHLWTDNGDPSDMPADVNYSLQNNKGGYIPGMFDVAHDNGLRTALYATKTKFSLFDHSYNNNNGAPDIAGADNGLNKIDTFLYNSDSLAVTAAFTAAMESSPFNVSLVHYTDGDTYGHGSGWGSSDYNNALVAVDGYLGQIFALVTGNPTLQGKTSIVLTADHGGTETSHSDNFDPLNYTIPFYIWGPDVEAGADLYTINPTTRLDPAGGRPAYTDPVQPIRNADAANLSLILLGLGAIPGSTINPSQGLSINAALPETILGTHPANPTTAADAAFSFSSPDSAASFECRLDLGSWSACLSGAAFSIAAAGSHTFQVRARSSEGNTDATPAWYSWIIDGRVMIAASGYTSLAAAAAAAHDGDVLKMQVSLPAEDFTFAGGGSITLEGGYGGDWSRQDGLLSPVSSIVTVNGTVIADRIVVQ